MPDFLLEITDNKLAYDIYFPRFLSPW